MMVKTALRLTPRGASKVLSRPRGGFGIARAPSGARAMAATIFKDVPQAPPDPILVRGARRAARRLLDPWPRFRHVAAARTGARCAVARARLRRA